MKEDETIDKLVNQRLSVFELTDKRCREVLIEIIRQLRRRPENKLDTAGTNLL